MGDEITPTCEVPCCSVIEPEASDFEPYGSSIGASRSMCCVVSSPGQKVQVMSLF